MDLMDVAWAFLAFASGVFGIVACVYEAYFAFKEKDVGTGVLSYIFLILGILLLILGAGICS